MLSVARIEPMMEFNYDLKGPFLMCDCGNSMFEARVIAERLGKKNFDGGLLVLACNACNKVHDIQIALGRVARWSNARHPRGIA